MQKLVLYEIGQILVEFILIRRGLSGTHLGSETIRTIRNSGTSIKLMLREFEIFKNIDLERCYSAPRVGQVFSNKPRVSTLSALKKRIT